MSGASRKRALSDDSPSAADKSKMRKNDGQALREIEPFDSIDGITREFCSIKNYVALGKCDAFQKILKRLEKSDTIVRVKQGQDVTPEQRIISLDDIAELRRLINQYVAKPIITKFDEQLEKMGSEDRIIKKQKNQREALREIEPFDSIDDVSLEFRSIQGYVAQVKVNDFQKILDRLEDSDTLVRRNQGEVVASDERIIYKEDITELQRLISLHVAKSVMAEFDEQLKKMGSEDRIIRKHSNRIENSNHEPNDVVIPEQDEPLQYENREEIGVTVDKAANLCLIDPLKEERFDNYDDVEVIEDVDGMQNDVPSDPKEEQVEVSEQSNDQEPDKIELDHAPMENSNREQLSVEVGKAPLCFIDPPKEEYVDVVPVHEMEVRDVPQLVETVPKIEPLEGDEQRIDPAVDTDAEQLESNPSTSAHQLIHKYDDDMQSMPSEKIENAEEMVDHSDSVSDDDVVEMYNEAPAESTDDPMETPEVEEDEQHCDLEVDWDAEQLEPSTSTSVQQLNHASDDTQSPSNPVKDHKEVIDRSDAASDGDVMETGHEQSRAEVPLPHFPRFSAGWAWLLGSGHEAPESNAELKESDDQMIEHPEDKNHEATPQPLKKFIHPLNLAPKAATYKLKMSSEEIQCKFGHLSDGELFRIILNERKLRKSTLAALKSKGNRQLDSFVVRGVHTVILLVKGSTDSEKVLLDKGPEYGVQLVLLIYTVLKTYDCSAATFEFMPLDYGTSLPFERFFHVMPHKFRIGILDVKNDPGVAPLLRYVLPKDLYVKFPSAYLFENDGELTANLKNIILCSHEVDKVDKLMECHTGDAELYPNSSWSDDSVKKVLTAHMDSYCVGSGREIICFYCNDHPKPHQRTSHQWRKLFDDWRLSYKAHPDDINKRIQIQTRRTEKIITFYMH